MTSSYWQHLLESRHTRRRTLVTAGLGSAVGVAALLMGCSSDGGSKPQRDSSGLLSETIDTTKQAVAGGTWESSLPTDFLGLDPLSSSSGVALADYVYNRPLKFKAGSPDSPPMATAVEGDAVESWELAPDGLQVTLKLRPNLVLDSRAPTNGRRLDTADVLSSWNRFSTTANGRGELINKINPSSPIDSLQIIDGRTFAFKLAFPIAGLLARLGTYRYLWVMPKESEGAFDPRTEMRGAGPWALGKATPSVSYEMVRNQSFYNTGRPFLDGINLTLIPEYAQGMAQFKTGRLWSYDVRSEDVLQTKKEQPKLVLRKVPISVTDRPYFLAFSQKPGSPFADVRVRRAISMLIDRDAFIDTFYNVPGFRAEGLDLNPRWHTAYGAGEAPFWHDPRGKELGEVAKYFQHDVKEATALMKAAGYTKAFESIFNIRVDRVRDTEAMAGFMEQDGLFKLTRRILQAADFNREIHTGNGLYDGIGASILAGPGPDIDMYLSARFNVPNNFAIFPAPVPGIQELVVKQRQEIDEKKRAAVLFELEKELASQMPIVAYPGVAETFSLAWPWLENQGAFVPLDYFSNRPSEQYPHYWYNKSKQV